MKSDEQTPFPYRYSWSAKYPLRVLDLCCGRGGFSAGFIADGWEAFGVDINPQPAYPGEFTVADVTRMTGFPIKGVFNLIIASPPCEEFSRHDQPWTRKRNPPMPSLDIVNSVRRIAMEAETPLIIENVRGAQKFIGKARYRFRSTYLWGDLPVLMPEIAAEHRQKQSYSSTRRDLRSVFPFTLSLALAQRLRCELAGDRYKAVISRNALSRIYEK